MPSKTKPTGSKKSGFTTTFVNFKLTGEAKDRFSSYMKDDTAEHAKDIVNLLGEGMKFSFSENRDGGFALASVTCREEGSINFDHCITSRSSDWYEALMMCVFKIHEFGTEESWVDQAGSDDWG